MSYRSKWKGGNIVSTSKKLPADVVVVVNVTPCQNYIHDNFKLQYKDTFPSNTTHYNYQEIALCVALRIFLRTKTLFYTLEVFDFLFLAKQRYQCSLYQLDLPEDNIYKSTVLFLTSYLMKYTVEVSDIVHYTCKVLNIPPYHIFRNIREFMYNDKSLKRACLNISALCLIPKSNEMLQACDSSLYKIYSNQCVLFSLIHRATIVSPSHFIEFSLNLAHFVISNALKDPNKKMNIKIHISVKDAFINLYSLFNKNEKKKCVPTLTRVSYYYYIINQIKVSYILTFNYFMSEFKPFYPVMIHNTNKIETNTNRGKPVVCESIHFHNSGNTNDYYKRLEKLTNKVVCDYLYKIRILNPTKPSGWRNVPPVDLFEMPKIEIMNDLSIILFIPSIVIHVTTPTRVPKKDEMLNKRYAWQICKFQGLTSSGYSQRRDPSGHVYSMNIAGGASNGRTKLLILFAVYFNRKYNSMIPNQQIHRDFEPVSPNIRRELIWTYVSCSLSNQCKSDRNFFAGVTDLTHRTKLITMFWPRYMKKQSFPVIYRMSKHKQNDDLLIHKGTVLSRISTVDSQIKGSIEEMIEQTKSVADYCFPLTALNFVMEKDHMMQFPPYIIYVFKLLFYKYMDIERVRRKLNPLLFSRRLYAQNGNWCISLSMNTEELWKLSSIKSNIVNIDYPPIIRNNYILIKKFIDFFKKTVNGKVVKGDDLPESLMNKEIYRFKYIPDPSIYLLTASKETFLSCPYYRYVYNLYKSFIDKSGGRSKFKDTYKIFDIIEEHREDLLKNEDKSAQEPISSQV